MEDLSDFLEDRSCFLEDGTYVLEDRSCFLVGILSEQRCVYEKCIVLVESLEFRRYVWRSSG